jgi:hypothetical protein
MKPLACWLGHHRWETRSQDGEEFSVCTACGKEDGVGGSAKGTPDALNTHFWDRHGGTP